MSADRPVKDVIVQVRMTADMKAEADDVAARNGLSFSELVRYLLAQKIRLDKRRTT